jgi:hypothetical protein
MHLDNNKSKLHHQLFFFPAKLSKYLIFNKAINFILILKLLAFFDDKC